MRKITGLLICIVLSVSWSSAEAESGGLNLASLFTDNMVLQQGRTIPVWGTAADGEKILAELNGKKASTVARNGKWRLWLPAMKQGGPYSLRVSCGEGVLERNNVLVGEVWIASGQSNMEWPLANALNADAEVAAANYPAVRFFTVKRATSITPLDSVGGTWTECNPKNAPGFSAVAYFFARKLHLDNGLNVGIIQTSWGGTPAEAWTDEKTLAADPELTPLLGPLEAFKAGANLGREQMQKRMAEWEAFWDSVFVEGDDLDRGWADPDADLSQWIRIEVPKEGSVLGGIDGVEWVRREVEIPEAWTGRNLVLKLGAIDDYDMTFVNGREVGRTYRDTPNWWMAQRVYAVPADQVRPGRNTIAVRICDNWLGGGFGGDPAALKIMPEGGMEGEAVPLAGSWMSRISFQFDPQKHPGRPEQGNESQVATMLYNAMIFPLIPYGIRGSIWYQGEANTSRYRQYRKLFPDMIRSWREAWNAADKPERSILMMPPFWFLFHEQHWMDGAFPFYFVQLANYMQRLDTPSESEWAGLREAQSRTLRLKNTGMAVAIDIGDAADIHPRNKQDVGKRLALWAEAKVYGRKDLEYSGPVFRKMKVRDGKAIVFFDHAEGGLIAKNGDKPEGFAVAGADGKFVWADAEIQADRVLVSSPQVPEPKAVRYGWADNPSVNLLNMAGLPASPFRTDVQ
jgi:sialate O-acetylesterase